MTTFIDYGYLELEYLVWPYLGAVSSGATGMQATILIAQAMGSQATIVIYNTDRMRILCDFASRGAATGIGTNAWGETIAMGLTWDATNTAVGDFDANNMNTDIVEQVFRSSGTSVTLSCDTEVSQGVAVDTIGILNHNLTSSAIVVVEASDTSTFSSVGFTDGVTWTKTDMYYIAPSFPFTKYRYWRFIISDTSNPDLYIQIGVIVFGAAMIFPAPSFTDNVRRRKVDYTDKIATEGYTNVANHRAYKRAITLNFKSMDVDSPGYSILEDIFDEDRTSVKCLWIPDPQDPSRYGIFAKLAEVPDEDQRNFGDAADLSDFVVNLDEAL